MWSRQQRSNINWKIKAVERVGHQEWGYQQLHYSKTASQPKGTHQTRVYCGNQRPLEIPLPEKLYSLQGQNADRKNLVSRQIHQRLAKIKRAHEILFSMIKRIK